MTDLVAPDEIEAIVGVDRDVLVHYARAVSAEGRVYLLHSVRCVESTPDLRACRYSRALDVGIDVSRWTEDVALRVRVEGGALVPLP